MNAEQQNLARRLVKHPAWRWMPGMRWIASRMAPLDDVVGRVGDLMAVPYPGAAPDFNDDATKGCLLALARELLDDPGWHPGSTSRGFTPVLWCAHVDGVGMLNAEGEAIAHAILAAPTQEQTP